MIVQEFTFNHLGGVIVVEKGAAARIKRLRRRIKRLRDADAMRLQDSKNPYLPPTKKEPHT